MGSRLSFAPKPTSSGGTADGPTSAGKVELTLGLPPSANNLYRHFRGSPKLTAVARKYAAHVKEAIGDQLLLSKFKAGDVRKAYLIDITVWLESVENKGWAEGKTKTRFREVDVDNRVKFVQDCVVKGLNVPNDSQILEDRARKKQGMPERVVVILEEIDPEPYINPNDLGQ